MNCLLTVKALSFRVSSWKPNMYTLSHPSSRDAFHQINSPITEKQINRNLPPVHSHPIRVLTICPENETLSGRVHKNRKMQDSTSNNRLMIEIPSFKLLAVFQINLAFRATDSRAHPGNRPRRFELHRLAPIHWATALPESEDYTITCDPLD
jgi:hypothetical protein